MGHLLIGFVGGLLAFPHCLGMCGGFMVHLAGSNGRKWTMLTQLAWLTGKLFTYTFCGAVAGYAGARAAVFLQHTYLQNLFSYLAGGLILLAGLNLLGLLPVKGAGGLANDGLLAGLCRPLIKTPSPGGALVFGIVTGFLPCPIVIGFLAYAMQSGSVSTGMATMAAMGLGTMLPLAALGGASSLVGSHLKSWGARAGGIILVLLGLATVLRGTELFHSLLGCKTQPAFVQASENKGSKGCCPGKPHDISSGN